MFKFWEQDEWIKLKTYIPKTDKTLTRVEYLRLVGAKKYNEEEYRRYLEIQEGEKTEEIEEFIF